MVLLSWVNLPAEAQNTTAMEVLSCLQGIVGVSDADCACYVADRPENYNASKSGLYLDQKVDLKMIAGAKGCGPGSVWDIGNKAINAAILTFQNNLLQNWSNRKHLKARKTYVGHLAQILSNRSRTPSGRYAGLVIIPNPVIEKGAVILKELGTVFTTSGTDVLSVSIYDAVELLHTIDLDTATRTHQRNTIEEPIVLPFRRDGVSEQVFHLIYELGDNKPRNNELICDCTATVKNAIAQWVEVYGTSGDDIEQRCDWATDHEFANGLVPDVEIHCDALAAICDRPLNFRSDTNAGTIAEYLQFAGAANLIGNILRSTDPNVFTVHPTEELSSLRATYMAEANARMAALSKSMDPGTCFICTSSEGMTTVTF